MRHLVSIDVKQHRELRLRRHHDLRSLGRRVSELALCWAIVTVALMSIVLKCAYEIRDLRQRVQVLERAR